MAADLVALAGLPLAKLAQGLVLHDYYAKHLLEPAWGGDVGGLEVT